MAEGPSGEWAGDVDLLQDEKERHVIFAVLDSFSQYRRLAHMNITHVRRQSFYALPQAHQEYLRKPPFSLLSTFSDVDDAIDANADLAESIMQAGAASLALSIPEDQDPPWTGYGDTSNMHKCRSTMFQLFRDWSAEGAVERQACYDPILQDLDTYCSNLRKKHKRKVLVPGSGLGRLVHEICKAGYEVEGNEISYHQLFASSFMLNCVNAANEVPYYPFAHSFMNQLTRANQLRKIMLPDELPAEALEQAANNTGIRGSMSVTTGDFCTVYSSEDHTSSFDAIATCFFIDTAPNLIRYVEAVRNCLKPDGIWINVGPLLWHFDAGRGPDETNRTSPGSSGTSEDRGIGEPGSFELTEDEVITFVQDAGFEILKHDVDEISTGYIQDPRSMLQHRYKPAHWVARHKRPRSRPSAA